MSTVLYKTLSELETAIDERNFLGDLHQKNVIINAKSQTNYYDVFRKFKSPFSIMYTYNGVEHYDFEGYHVTTSPSNLVIIAPGEKYASFIDTDTDVHCLSFYFSEKFVLDLFNPSIFFIDNSKVNFPKILKQKKLILIDRRTKKLLREFNNIIHSHYSSDQLIIAMSQLLLNTFSTYRGIWDQTLSNDATKLSTKIEVSRRLFRVKDYIYSNYQKDIDLEDLGNISFMNQYYLIRKFRNFFGVTPYQMLLNRRIEVAREQILTSDDPISSIAASSGFNNLPNFYSSFKNKYHITPTNLRS